MTFEDCRKFANENPRCFLGTVDGEKPRVRGMHMLFCNDRGFHFTTGSWKGVYAQLTKNPRAEVCFFSLKESRSMRVEGEAEFITGIEEKEEIFKKVEWLKNIIGSHDNALWTPFRIKKGRCHFWTMQTNMEKPIFIDFEMK